MTVIRILSLNFISNYWITFTQAQLDDLVRDLGLPKDKSEYLALELKRQSVLAKEESAYVYRDRKKDFTPFFAKGDSSPMVYCFDVERNRTVTRLKNGNFLLICQSVV